MKLINTVRRYGAKLPAVAAGSLVSASAFASTGGTDYSSLTSSLSWSSAVTAVMAVAGLLIVVLAAKKGARMVLSMVGR